MRERAWLGATCFVFVVWAMLTMQRVELWRDPVALWLEAVRRAPCQPRPRAQLALEYAKAGQIEASQRAWLAAAEITMRHQCPPAP